MKDLTNSMEMSEKFDKEQSEVEKKAAAEVEAQKTGQPSVAAGAASTASEAHTAGSSLAFLFTRTPRSFLARLLSMSSPDLYTYLGLPPSSCKHFALDLVVPTSQVCPGPFGWHPVWVHATQHKPAAAL